MARKPKAMTPTPEETTIPSSRRTRTRNSPQPGAPMNGFTGEEEIRDLAYRKWEEAGCPTGDGMAFWLAAEQEL
ncbi:MAG TPA: DUF2934 domain-containing protein, partial [Gemmataceae bacterium]|nr:DUF2934 domain-containing protein [Gemmataceae bacterium]